MSIPSDEAVAWFFMSEGCATISCSRRNEKKGLMSILGYRAGPAITLTNTDNALLESFTNWCKVKGIKYYSFLQKIRFPKHASSKAIRVATWKDSEKFVLIIKHFMIGEKKQVCELMLEYLLKYGRRDWAAILREKVVRDKKTGRILTVNWDVEEERGRFLEIMKLRDQILAINGGHRAKYNYDFFAKLWGM